MASWNVDDSATVYIVFSIGTITLNFVLTIYWIFVNIHQAC